jgi:uncharacterized membrane protein
MDTTIKSVALFIAIFLTGLSAGLFYTWSVSVIPGTRMISDINYLTSMKSINRAILNPWFFVIFFGSLISLVFSSWQLYGTSTLFWMALSATLAYLFGTFGVTIFGNVPLNNELEALNIETLKPVEILFWREYYEPEWNRLHTIRTVFAVISFLLVLGSTFFLNQIYLK